MLRHTEAPEHIFLDALFLPMAFRRAACSSHRCFYLGHLPFSGPFRNRVSLFVWYHWLRNRTWEASFVISYAWALHTSICLKLVGSLGLPSLQSEVQLPHPSRSRGKEEARPAFLSALPVDAFRPQQQQQLQAKSSTISGTGIRKSQLLEGWERTFLTSHCLSPDPPLTPLNEPVQMDQAKENGRRCLQPHGRPHCWPQAQLQLCVCAKTWHLATAQSSIHSLQHVTE